MANAIWSEICVKFTRPIGVSWADVVLDKEPLYSTKPHMPVYNSPTQHVSTQSISLHKKPLYMHKPKPKPKTPTKITTSDGWTTIKKC